MLVRKDKTIRQQISMVSLEDLVPDDHLLRIIEQAINFDFIYDLVKGLYSETKGRPSIDPVVLIKMSLLQVLFGISSMRQTVREIHVNNAYRWFLGYGLHEPIPHFSVFSKNYERRFKNTDLFEKIFEYILLEARENGFVTADAVFIDATHVKASANKGKSRKEMVAREVHQYKKQLMQEIEADRINEGKKPLPHHDDDDPRGDGTLEMKETTVSTTDQECGLFHKGEKERCFAYGSHVACDKNNFILGHVTAPGNIHDSIVFSAIYAQIKSYFSHQITSVVVDAGYKTPGICKEIIDDGKIPVMPYKRPLTKPGNFKKYEYVYDEYFDCYLCPHHQILSYSTTNRDGYREYKSNPKLCASCPLIRQCTQSKNQTKVILRHLWEHYLEEAEDIRHHLEYRDLYKLRGETIERVFADAKEKHGMRYTRLRGRQRVHDQLTLLYAGMNLKKLAMWKKKLGMLTPQGVFTNLFNFILLPNRNPLSGFAA
ncbi:MAG TPA: IS1182 family transposase [Negativicutes bacterium]|nr:IS1182 family transposase [Negativicutes bacterium]